MPFRHAPEATAAFRVTCHPSVRRHIRERRGRCCLILRRLPFTGEKRRIKFPGAVQTGLGGEIIAASVGYSDCACVVEAHRILIWVGLTPKSNLGRSLLRSTFRHTSIRGWTIFSPYVRNNYSNWAGYGGSGAALPRVMCHRRLKTAFINADDDSNRFERLTRASCAGPRFPCGSFQIGKARRRSTQNGRIRWTSRAPWSIPQTSATLRPCQPSV